MNEARLAAWQAKVQVTDFCWQWTASLTKGYGQFRVLRPDGTISRYAHQASFEHFFGPVPDGYEIDHVVCGVKTCVYPGHHDEAEGGRHRKRDQAERALAKMYPAEYRKVYDGG